MHRVSPWYNGNSRLRRATTVRYHDSSDFQAAEEEEEEVTSSWQWELKIEALCSEVRQQRRRGAQAALLTCKRIKERGEIDLFLSRTIWTVLR